METRDKAKFDIVLVTGVVEKNGKFLIAQRSFEEVQAPGRWSLPGGKVEVKGQDLDVLEKALRKEIKEEVGVTIEKKLTYVRSGSFIRIDGAPVVDILFLCKWKSGQARPLEDSVKVAWIKIEDADKYQFAVGMKRALTAAAKKLGR